MDRRVFISYSSKDQSLADGLRDELARAGLEPWIATSAITPATNFAQSIAEALDHSAVLVLLLTDHANRSSQIPLELNLALSKRVPVLPVRLSNAAPAAALEYFLATSQWLDARAAPAEAHWPAVLAHVRRILRGDRTAAVASRSRGGAAQVEQAQRVRTAFQFGFESGLVTRLENFGDVGARKLEAARGRGRCEELARRLELPADSGTASEIPQNTGLTAAMHGVKLRALAIQAKWGAPVGSAAQLGHQICLLPIFADGEPARFDGYVAELRRLAERSRLSDDDVVELASKVRSSDPRRTPGERVVEYRERTLLRIEDSILFTRAVAIQRANVWELAHRISMSTLGLAEGAPATSVLRVRAEASVFAGALGFVLPELAPSTEDPAANRAAAIHYLLHPVGGELSAVLRDVHGSRFSALLELGIKSMLLLMLYHPDDDRIASLVESIERSGRASAVAEEMWSGVIAIVRARATHADVTQEVVAARSRMGEYLEQIVATSE